MADQLTSQVLYIYIYIAEVATQMDCIIKANSKLETNLFIPFLGNKNDDRSHC